MVKSEIKIGEEYALRERRVPDAPLQRVRMLQHVRGRKWKAQWIDPNPGLVDYVESKDLLIAWKDRRAYLRDEEAMRRLREHGEQHGAGERTPIGMALSESFESAQDGPVFYRGILEGDPEALGRVKDRARVDRSRTSPLTHTDRHGRTHVAFEEALELAKAFCAAEPATVLAHIEAQEREWSHDALQPGKEYLVGLLNEYRAAWAIIRQWAGHDAAVAQREAQIQRLERLVWDAIYALQKAGLDDEAHRLRRALGRT